MFGQVDSIQNRDLKIDSLSRVDTTRTDSIIVFQDSIPASTQRPNRLSDPLLQIKISDQAFDNVIERGATDSSYVDLKENQIHLFGNAYVKYQSFDLQAGYIIFDMDDNTAFAQSLEGIGGKKLQKPVFTDGSNNFTANSLKYNFKTNKGLVFDAITNEGEFTIHGERTKFVSKSADADTLADTKDHIYNQNAIITTCTADHPHYGIKARKLKVIPNRLAIIGFSQLEIFDIPTPIILPFGFFPLVEGRSSGIIFPDNYEYNEQLGLGFREVGYYFPINDYMDLRVTGDIYTRGTHRINLRSNYKKRYKYTGNVALSYANNISESTVDGSRVSNKGFRINVTHNQDAKAHPYIKIGGNINLSLNRFDQDNAVDYNQVVNNKIQSNFSFRHDMPGTPFSFTAGFSHNQDNQTRKVNVTFPDATLRMNTIYPFKNPSDGKEYWYEKINMNYNAKFKNYVSSTDTTLFTQETLDNLQTGLSHDASINFNQNVLKYFNFNTSVNLDQIVLTRYLQRELDPTLILDSIGVELDQDGNETILYDTTYGTINEFYKNDLTSFEDFSVSAGLSTQLFATKRFSKGWLRGLRHTMRPTIGFSYRPDSRSKYIQEVQVSSNPNDIDEVQEYNPYSGGAFNPSLSSRQMALTYNIQNFFEGKYYSKSDSTEKKFKFLRQMSVSGNYNFAADSLNFSPLAIRGNTSLFKGITTLNFNASYNFYKQDERGRLINETVWSRDGRPVEFDQFTLTVTNGVTVSQIREMIFGKKKAAQPTSRSNNPNDARKARQPQSMGDAIDNFRISHSFRYQIERLPTGCDTSQVRAHSIQLSGSIQMSTNWNLRVQNISYDLKNKTFVYPQFSLSRDLHCWEMLFSWTPAREIYSFHIGVKSSTLSFLSYDYGQRNANNLFGR